jgi:hypothetical protein
MAMDSHLTGLADEMAKLLVSGDYSDLTLRCSDGAELPVHRNVVCRRSTVLAAACSGRFAVNDFQETSHFFCSFSIRFLFIQNPRFPCYFRAQTACFLVAPFISCARSAANRRT